VFASSRTARSEFLVTDTVMWNWWYDRQGAIQTSGLSFVDDLPRFFILLFAWQRFTEEDWGIVPQGQPRRTFTCDNGVKFTLVRDQRPIHRPYGIVGRGTMVLRATSTSDELKGRRFVTKFSNPEKTRIRETEMLDTIRVKASHLPDVADHILDYTATRSTDYSTSHIRERLGLNTKGARKLTIVVFEKLEGDISALDGIEMWEVAYQIDKCGYSFLHIDVLSP
jgi:hypothetical protein